MRAKQLQQQLAIQQLEAAKVIQVRQPGNVCLCLCQFQSINVELGKVAGRSLSALSSEIQQNERGYRAVVYVSVFDPASVFAQKSI